MTVQTFQKIEKIVTFEVTLLVWALVLLTFYATFSKITSSARFYAFQFPYLTGICKRYTAQGSELSDKTIILRVDDIQSGAFEQASLQILKEAKKFEFPLVLGVIPRTFDIKSDIFPMVKQNLCNNELALHGWDHSYIEKAGGITFEFESLTAHEADERITNSKKKIYSLFKVTPTTFIPPGNLISDGAITALSYHSIRIISSDDHGLYDSSISYNTFENSRLVSNDEVFEVCNEKFSKGLPCIIVIHPQDFNNTAGEFDQNRFQQFSLLLNEIAEKKIAVRTFQQMSPQ